MILGIGLDIVQVDLFRDILADRTSSFKQHHFTEREIVYCESQAGHDPVLHYAGRYAAKEAYIKARGAHFKQTPTTLNINYREIEVVTEPSSGPALQIHGVLAARLRDAGGAKIFVSITHEASVAAAMVVLER